MPLGMEVGFSPGDFVLDGDPALLPKKGLSPQFSAHVYCGQTAAWKMPVGTEVGLGPGDCVRWGPSYPQKKGTPTPTQFLAHVYCGHGRPSQLLLSSFYTWSRKAGTGLIVRRCDLSNNRQL